MSLTQLVPPPIIRPHLRSSRLGSRCLLGLSANRGCFEHWHDGRRPKKLTSYGRSCRCCDIRCSNAKFCPDALAVTPGPCVNQGISDRAYTQTPVVMISIGFIMLVMPQHGWPWSRVRGHYLYRTRSYDLRTPKNEPAATGLNDGSTKWMPPMAAPNQSSSQTHVGIGLTRDCVRCRSAFGNKSDLSVISHVAENNGAQPGRINHRTQDEA